MASPIREKYSRWRLGEVLKTYPGLRVLPVANGQLSLAGKLTFSADAPGHERIDDTYELRISVPSKFPDDLPSVRETAGRVPKSFHTNSDGSLCLGSPLRLRLAVAQSPTLPNFVTRCIIPFLYGFSFREKYGKLPFGELAHGAAGLRQDFAALFRVKSDDAAQEMVRLASLKKRVANKHPCPCGGRRRLGKCHHLRVNWARVSFGRPWLREQYSHMSRS
jgi:hypothetical protein